MQIENPTDQDYANLEGWCEKDKRVRMIGLLRECHANVYIEIGVYGGSSLIPVAKEFTRNEFGIAHGIDPWSNEASTNGFSETDPNHTWWGDLSHSWVKGIYERDLKRYGVENHVKTYVMTSEKAAPLFTDGTADVIHIDGNHSEENSSQDVGLWVPKLRAGGYLIMDDINWLTTRKAQNLLVEELGCEVLEQYDGYAIYRKLHPDCNQ